MSDCFWARIQIGGQIKESEIPGFMNAIVEDDIFIENITENYTENIEDLKKYISLNAEGIFEVEEGEALKGEFRTLEKWCKDTNHPFIRENDSYSDYEAELVWWTPDKEGSYLLSNNGDPVIDYNTIYATVIAMEKIKIIEDVPLYVNSDDQNIKNYAAFIAREGSLNPVKYFKQRLNEICPTPPDLPPFEIIND